MAEQTAQAGGGPASPEAPAGRSEGREGRPARDRERERDRGRGREGGRRFFRRRKVCKFCVEHIDHIDYKDVKVLVQFVTERGKILPRRLSGVCSPHQRQLKVAVKRARNIALLPFAAPP